MRAKWYIHRPRRYRKISKPRDRTLLLLAVVVSPQNTTLATLYIDNQVLPAKGYSNNKKRSEIKTREKKRRGAIPHWETNDRMQLLPVHEQRNGYDAAFCTLNCTLGHTPHYARVYPPLLLTMSSCGMYPCRKLSVVAMLQQSSPCISGRYLVNRGIDARLRKRRNTHKISYVTSHVPSYAGGTKEEGTSCWDLVY